MRGQPRRHSKRQRETDKVETIRRNPPRTATNRAVENGVADGQRRSLRNRGAKPEDNEDEEEEEMQDEDDNEDEESEEDDEVDNTGPRWSFRDRDKHKREITNVSDGVDRSSSFSQKIPTSSHSLNSRRNSISALDRLSRLPAGNSSRYGARHSSKKARTSYSRHRPRKSAGWAHSNSSSSSSSSDDSDDSRDQGTYGSHRHSGSSFSRRHHSSSASPFESRPPARSYHGAGIPPEGHGGKHAAQASRADIQPIKVDALRDASWESVGGLDEHVASLKEMVTLPLLYPQLFAQFGLQPPRGVLFHGPPGTGKTLVARALAAESARQINGGASIAFFMRKGADVLSKWVGEAERQLRLLFDAARYHAPSIVFFDEIDGLAPVRSSKQDQIHASIVSTLLALMDGLDSRGHVIVIGATNRPDHIDPALRRPGRFDRELEFKLPNASVRRTILGIHTKAWTPPLAPALTQWIAEETVGYCGADIKAVCAEAALGAFRRRYPQVYRTRDCLRIDPKQVQVTQQDFARAISGLIAASKRSALASPARPLPAHLRGLLGDMLAQIVEGISILFPAFSEISKLHSRGGKSGAEKTQTKNSNEESAPFANSDSAVRSRLLLSGPRGNGQKPLAQAALHALEELPTFSLDLSSLLSGGSNDGLASSLCTDLVALFAAARRAAPSVMYIPNVEKWCRAGSDSNASETNSSGIGLGDVAAAFSSSSSSLATPVATANFDPREELLGTLLCMLHEMDPAIPVFLLSTAEVTYMELPKDLREALTCGFASSFGGDINNRYLHSRSISLCGICEVSSPEEDLRTAFIDALVESIKAKARHILTPSGQFLKSRKSSAVSDGKGGLDNHHGKSNDIDSNDDEEQEILEVVEPPQSQKSLDLSQHQLLAANRDGLSMLDPDGARKQLKDEHSLRELRICLSSVLHGLQRDKKFAPFWKPVDPEESPDYYVLVRHPMDLETIRARIDAGFYLHLDLFMRDIELIRSNAEQYNPRYLKPARGRDMAHHARELVDSVQSHIYKLKGQIGHVFRRCDRIALERLYPAEDQASMSTHAAASLAVSVNATTGSKADISLMPKGYDQTSSGVPLGNGEDGDLDEGDNGEDENDKSEEEEQNTSYHAASLSEIILRANELKDMLLKASNRWPVDYFGAAYERVELAMRTFEADRSLPELQKSLSFVSKVSDVL